MLAAEHAVLLAAQSMTPNLSNPVRSAVMVRAWNPLRSHVPHPVFAPDGTTMVAVTNSLQYKDATTKAGDAVFTVQPVGTEGLRRAS